MVTVVATDATAVETRGHGDVHVQRTGPTTNAITVSYAVSGTATNGSDYNTLFGSVTIPAGQASATQTVTALADVQTDDNDTVTVTIGPGGSPPYAIGTPNVATVTIIDTSGVDMEWATRAIESTPRAVVGDDHRIVAQR